MNVRRKEKEKKERDNSKDWVDEDRYG